jgi:acetyl esterase/lipase
VRRHADEWGIDRRRVGVLGFSAGGHLASTLATHWELGRPASSDPLEWESSRPDAQILCYPVITFGPHRHEGSMVALLGEDPPAYRRELLSNELQVKADTPPAFIWHTADDEAVPVENSLLFAGALRARGVPFELHIFPHGRHGLGLAEDDAAVGAWTGLCAAWLRRLGWITADTAES